MKMLTAILALLLMVGSVGFSDEITSITEEKEDSTWYYLFDDFNYVGDVMSKRGLSQEQTSTSHFIVDRENGVTNWSVESARTESFVNEVVQNIMADGTERMTKQKARVTIKYLNNDLLDQVFYDDEPSFESIVLSTWLKFEAGRQSEFDRVSERASLDERTMLTEAVISEDLLHYISGPVKRESTQVNVRHYATHKELYGSFILEIVVEGGWSDHAQVSSVLEELIAAAKAEADLALQRVDFYNQLFSEEVVELEEEDEVQYVISGRLKLMDGTGIDVEEIGDNQTSVASDYALSLLNKRVENQMVFLSIFNENGEAIAVMGPELTDQEGRFEFEYPYDFEEEYDMVLVTPLVHLKKNDKDSMTYAVMDRKHFSGTNDHVYLKLADQTIYREEDLQLGDLFLIGIDTVTYTNGVPRRADFVNGFIYALAYQHLEQVEDFYTETIGYELPVDKEKLLKIYLSSSDVLNKNQAANYDHSANYINVSDALTTWASFDHLDSVLFHEFSHKVMFDRYGGRYPKASASDSLIGTYANETTAHSLTEGFAYFMQHVISEYYGGSGKDFPSPVYGNLEPDHPAWLNGGLHEARAVAGVLYDLYDGPSGEEVTDDDQVSIPIKSLLETILSKPLDSFAALYERLLVTYPDEKEGIDKIVIAHGFFSVEEALPEGIGEYHPGEAFVDTNQNYTYDQGEKVINYNAVDETGLRFQAYKEGSKIGYASYKGNENRQMQAYDPLYRIKTESPFESYTLSVEFPQAPGQNYTMPVGVSEGYIHLTVIPYHEPAKISLVPTGYDGEVQAFTMTSEEIRRQYAEIRDQGYLAEWSADEGGRAQLLSDLPSVLPPMVNRVLAGVELDVPIDQALEEKSSERTNDAFEAYSFQDVFPEQILVVEKTGGDQEKNPPDGEELVPDQSAETEETTDLLVEEKQGFPVGLLLALAGVALLAIFLIVKRKSKS